MPIHRSLATRPITDEEFDLIDEAVMRCAYAVQNKFGRLFDEAIYENDLAARLQAEGFDVHTQVPLQVVHGSFEKSYYLDLVVNHMLYELKVVKGLLPEHQAQGLNYAMLQDTRRVKLINFGESKVRSKLLRNALTTPDRHQPRMRASGWRILTPQCESLVSHLRELIKDWGTHLDSHLYCEALIHHCGGEAHCLQRLDVSAGTLKLGSHLVQLFAPRHAFVVTAFPSYQPAWQRHLEVLLDHVALRRGAHLG